MWKLGGYFSFVLRVRFLLLFCRIRITLQMTLHKVKNSIHVITQHLPCYCVFTQPGVGLTADRPFGTLVIPIIAKSDRFVKNLTAWASVLIKRFRVSQNQRECAEWRSLPLSLDCYKKQPPYVGVRQLFLFSAVEYLQTKSGRFPVWGDVRFSQNVWHFMRIVTKCLYKSCFENVITLAQASAAELPDPARLLLYHANCT